MKEPGRLARRLCGVKPHIELEEAKEAAREVARIVESYQAEAELNDGV